MSSIEDTVKDLKKNLDQSKLKENVVKVRKTVNYKEILDDCKKFLTTNVSEKVILFGS